MKPRLYAHRGAAAELPENTLPSFDRAVSYGVDALEMDVHMTADGHVVVHHDATGERMCGVAAAIRETPLSEVARWDAGHGFRDAAGDTPYRGTGVRIPTLDAVLSEFSSVVINIDIKQPRPPMVRQTLDVIARHGAADRVILASFHQRTLWRVRAAGYAGLTAMAAPELIAVLALPPAVFSRLPLTGAAAQIPPAVRGLTLATPERIRRLQRAGVRVDFWTINDPDQARELIAAGADGIMTDDPAAIAPVFQALPG